ncbi:hypothetical protein L3X38_003522 [Prunus dulcis]|uniref:Uncharacterized protein n=1 Tax=Prunus dulcis TaxID=3755 RepID=A0AAD4ZM81_PRUDU|nr:hypothetical protein L3X38_003522 [Prunus dulcis]
MARGNCGSLTPRSVSLPPLGEYGIWTTFLALLLHLFFFIPDWYDYGGSNQSKTWTCNGLHVEMLWGKVKILSDKLFLN